MENYSRRGIFEKFRAHHTIPNLSALEDKLEAVPLWLNQPKTRREAISLGAGAAISFAQEVERGQDEEPSVEYVRPLWPILGIHDTPEAGGSLYRTVAVSDMNRLGALWALVIQPERPYIDMLSQAGIKIIARMYQPGSRPSPRHINEILQQFDRLPANIIPYNEVNLSWETENGVYIPADVHIKRDFIPVANQLVAAGHKVGLTPLSPNLSHFNIAPQEYYEDMLKTLVAEKGPAWVRTNIFVALHFYPIDDNLDQEWQRLEKIHKFNQSQTGNAGLPIHITETCFFTSDGAPSTQGIAALKNIEMLQKGMPDLPIESFCLWVLSNLSQRPPAARQNASHITEFERSVLRRDRTPEGETELFRLLAQIKSEGAYLPVGNSALYLPTH